MSASYAHIQSLRIGGKDIAVRATEFSLTEERHGILPSQCSGSIEFNVVGRILDEQWLELVEMLGASERAHYLAQEIRAAECELFAAMLRYWTFL